jgi:UDP-N-acetylmuramoyl-L-alanyl-D-glutamate--2,6-diaminopimelate ligase
MTEPSPERTIEALVGAAEPTTPKAVAGLVARLAATGRLRGVRRDGRPIAAAGLADVTVRGPVQDSRRVRPGDLFVAVPGDHVDGHDFIEAAVAAGVSAVVVERPLPEVAVPQLVVDAARPALAEAAGWWYEDPSRELGVVGVTGTDGKTTTSFLAVAALEAAGLPAGLVGTVALQVGGVREPTPEHVTTPEAPQLQALLRTMVTAGDAAAIVETTSHGLALDRVAGTTYAAAVFTNLTHEHLELHGSFEAYRAAKLRLFERLAQPGPTALRPDGRPWPRLAIVNRDDASASWFMAAAAAAGARLITYGTDPAADVRATQVEEDARRLRLAYDGPTGPGRLELRLAGRFNAHNALAVVALGIGLELDGDAVRGGLEGLAGVPGRMERIEAGQPFGVIVDYAHSPASLATVLDLLAPVAAAQGGGLVAVFGSAGERDRAKRPMMGRIAGERCRLVVVTDEDPRGEDAETILEEIAAGAEAAGRHHGKDLLIIADRAVAIVAAFEHARPGDIVLLAGKGHERTILHADGARPWDERGAALAALAALGYRDERVR